MPGSGRKKLKQGALRSASNLPLGGTIRRVVSLRGSNIIEAEDVEFVRTLCLLPAKFNKILWIRKGSFVVVQEGDREKVLELGNKVTGIICQVLFEEQIRSLKKSLIWPSAFEESKLQPESQTQCLNSKDDSIRASSSDSSDGCSSEDEGLLPLEANQNRRTVEFDVLESSSDEED